MVLFSRSPSGGDPHFDDSFAVGTADDDAALPLFDVQAFGRVALRAREAGGAAGVDGLDHLVPDGFEGGQAIFGVVVHVPGAPLLTCRGIFSLTLCRY